MAAVTNSLNGLAYLMQAGNPLSNLPASLSAADLQSAPLQDVVSLSLAAIQMQQVNELFGIPPAAQDTLPALPISATQSTDALPGVPAADLVNASPQEQAAVNYQALLLQQVEGLFAESTSAAGATDLIG